MARRVGTYCELHRRQFFYEPLSSHASIVRAMAEQALVTQGAWLGRSQQDDISIDVAIFDGAYTAERGRLQFPSSDEQPVGIHSVRLVGYDDSGETLVFQNSWGAGWGDHGYGSVTRPYLDRYLHDCWLSKNARYGFTRFDRASRLAAETTGQVASIWLRENPRWRKAVALGSRRRRLYWYETISLQDWVPVTVIELRSGEDFRLAWAILFHERDGTSVLKELFVWPTFRRRGFGTLVEREAVAIARSWHSTKMLLYLHSADALPGNRIAGSSFGRRAGYAWHWHRTKLPNLDAIGEKTL